VASSTSATTIARAGERRPELPAWLWLGLPPLLLGAQLAVRAHDQDAYLRWVEGEQGVIENLTVAFLAGAVAAGVLALRGRARLPRPRLAGWLLALTVGCVYFAGEEVSWGQHWFGWETPEAIERVNDQRETNLHNISSWLDQKPRLLLELWVLVGGVAVALRRRLGAAAYDERSDWRAWFWPTWVAFPAALLAIGVRLPERVADLLGWEWGTVVIRYSEAQELFFALFLLLYMLSIQARLRALARDG